MSDKTPWTVNVLTLFPEMFPGPLGCSLAGKALLDEIWSLNVINIRDFASDRHKTVDDKPFGGGAGMIMRADVIGRSLDYLAESGQRGEILYMSPRGEPLNQKKVKELKSLTNITILCGRFEGVDQRVLDEYDVKEVSIGDFVLSGGEIAAFALIDACIRLLPGVIEKKEILEEESFGDSDNYSGLLEYPHYTRPYEWKNLVVPEVPMSGNHHEIKKWRLEQARKVTRERRQDLWTKYSPTTD